MRMIHFAVILFILPASGILLGADENAAPQDKPAEPEKTATVADIPALVKRLDSDDFDERQEARGKLSTLGHAALKALKAARFRAASAETKTALNELIHDLMTRVPFDSLTGAEQLVAASWVGDGSMSRWYGIDNYRIYEFGSIRIAIEKFPTVEEHTQSIDVTSQARKTERGMFAGSSYRISYKPGSTLLILPGATVRLTNSQLTVAGESLVRDGRKRTVFLTRGGNLKMIYYSENE